MSEIDVMLTGAGYDKFDRSVAFIGDGRQPFVVKKTAALDRSLSSRECKKIELASHTL